MRGVDTNGTIAHCDLSQQNTADTIEEHPPLTSLSHVGWKAGRPYVAAHHLPLPLFSYLSSLIHIHLWFEKRLKHTLWDRLKRILRLKGAHWSQPVYFFLYFPQHSGVIFTQLTVTSFCPTAMLAHKKVTSCLHFEFFVLARRPAPDILLSDFWEINVFLGWKLEVEIK